MPDSTPAAEVSAPAPADLPAANPLALLKRPWTEHAARLTALLAVLAAMSSGQYADRFSHTILAQAEASDAWAHYQAKSIKRNLSQGQLELVRALADGRPELSPALAKLEATEKDREARYEAELADLKARAEATEERKRHHAAQGDRFQYAFVSLQAGVVLSSIAGSGKRPGIWALAAIAGLLGLLLIADGFLLVV